MARSLRGHRSSPIAGALSTQGLRTSGSGVVTAGGCTANQQQPALPPPTAGDSGEPMIPPTDLRLDAKPHAITEVLPVANVEAALAAAEAEPGSVEAVAPGRGPRAHARTDVLPIVAVEELNASAEELPVRRMVTCGVEVPGDDDRNLRQTLFALIEVKDTP